MIDEPLLKSSIREELWKMRETDPERFKQEVTTYFAKGYPGWMVVKTDGERKIVFLKDVRRG